MPTEPTTPVAGTPADPAIPVDPAAPAATGASPPVAETPKVEVSYIATVGVDAWTSASAPEGDRTYAAIQNNYGVRISGTQGQVRPYGTFSLGYRVGFNNEKAGADDVNTGDATEDQLSTLPADEDGDGDEAAGEATDPGGSSVGAGTEGTAADDDKDTDGNANINNSDVTHMSNGAFVVRPSGGVDFILKEDTKGTTALSVGGYLEMGAAWGDANVSGTNGVETIKGFMLGVGPEVGFRHTFRGKEVDASVGVGGYVGYRHMSYAIPGDGTGAENLDALAFGGTVQLGFSKHREIVEDGATAAVTQPGTLTQADLTELQKLVNPAWIKGEVGAKYFEIDFPEGANIKDATGRTIDKITFTWDPSQSAWLSTVYVQGNTTPVTDSGFTAEHRSVADMVSSLTSLIFKLVSMGSDTSKTVAGLGTYERPDSDTVLKDQPAHLGFVTSPTEIKVTVRINGVDLPDKITIPANTRTPIVIPAAKLGSANLVLDRPFPVSIRNEMQGGVELAFNYQVQPVAPPAPVLSNASASKSTTNDYRFINDTINISVTSSGATSADVYLGGRKVKTVSLVDGVNNNILITKIEYGSTYYTGPVTIKLPTGVSISTTETLVVGKKPRSGGGGGGGGGA